MGRQIILREICWILRIQIEQFLHVEELHSVPDGFGADDGEVVDDADFAPVGADGIVLGQAAEIADFAIAGDFGEGGAVVLSDGDEFAAVF